MRNRVLELFRRRQIALTNILDVGANVGQSYAEFREFAPGSVIHCFEPVAASYMALKAMAGHDQLAHCHKLALSRTSGTLIMTSKGTSTGNRVLSAPRDSEVEQVPSASGDSFCASIGLQSIDFLKIDAEGHDLEVVMGFSEMLTRRGIKFIQVECGFSRFSPVHVSYFDVASVLGAFNYGLYGVFDLTPRRGSNELAAQYGNAVFVRYEQA
jgi:FkbM family methyltransferase